MDRPERCTIDERPPVLDISDDESCVSMPHILLSEDEIYRIDEEDEDEDSDANDHRPPWVPWAAQREDDGNATQGSDSDLHEDDPHPPDDDLPPWVPWAAHREDDSNAPQWGRQRPP